MLRGLVAVLTGASFFVAALAAPMTHVHETHGDGHDGHHGRVVHSHVAGHRAAHGQDHDRPAVAAPDDAGTARALNLFQVLACSYFPLVGLPVAVSALVPPPTRPGVVVTIAPRSHSPPYFRSLASRAPPARLS